MIAPHVADTTRHGDALLLELSEGALM